MSKSSESGLTGSGKRPRRAARPHFRPDNAPRAGTGRPGASALRKAAPVLPGKSRAAIACLDRLHGCCDEIAAVAGLMERCGEDPSATLTAGLGIWMSRKLRDIKALAQAMWEAR